jgi:hypothetical protein
MRLRDRLAFDLIIALSGRHAEVVTFIAGSLEAGGLPGYPEVLVSLK